MICYDICGGSGSLGIFIEDTSRRRARYPPKNLRNFEDDRNQKPGLKTPPPPPPPPPLTPQSTPLNPP